MHHHLLFVMSLSGSAVVALYALLYPIIKRYVSISWQKNILKFAIFFYLFPLPLFKKSIVISICNLFPTLTARSVEMPQSEILNMNYAINLQPGDAFFGSEVLLIGVFICCMGAITSFVMVIKLKQYLALSQTYRSAFSERPSPYLIEQFERLKEELKIRRTINFICSPFCKAPITIGIFSPIIVFPTADASTLDPISDTHILKHELLHVKNRDFLVKTLSIIVLALHWYNPICYFLYREICIVCEMNCDHEVVKDFDETLRQRYSNLILDLATKNYTEKEKLAVGLVNGDMAAFERRILEMKVKRNSKLAWSAVVVLTICLVGSMTAFAYEAPPTYDITDFDPDGEYLLSFPLKEEVVVPLPYSSFFTDGEGNIYPIDMNDSKVICTHQFIEGSLSKHKKTSDGGCITTEQKAWRCSSCGYMKAGDIISETKYTICPH